MFHLNFNWIDMLNPLHVNARSSTLGTLLEILLVNEVEKRLPEKQDSNSLVLKNHQTGDVIAIQPDSYINIDNQDTKFKFQSYDYNDNSILVKSGRLEFEYDLSTVKTLSIRLKPELSSKEMIGATAASLIGGTAGFAVGTALGSTSRSKYADTELGGGMLGCTLGMAAAPALYLSSTDGEYLEISLDEWSVQ